ncbi:hypothetical protein C0J52_01217 [Blattella germanica]|nr:hypothetical protein C0J52_01217 [Blattella germanica]
MTALISSRKRVRGNNCEEECCDFMPLSKRINNLHINNSSFCTGLGFQHSDASDVYESRPENWRCVASGENNLEHNGNVPLHNQNYSDGNDCQNGSNASNCIPHQSNSPVVNGNVNTGNQSGGWMTDNILSQYTPALNASDNPYYYENNKLLFALYMERLQRNGDALY